MLRHPLLPNASLVHLDSDGKAITIAHTIAVAESRFSKIFGQMFTNSIDEDFVLVFPLGRSRSISLHMLFVPYDLGAIYLEGTEIKHMEVMDAWTGTASGRGDTILEVHPSLLTNLEVGDQLYLQGDHSIEELSEPENAPRKPWFK